MPRALQPPPEPVEAHTTRIVLIGTVLWALAFLALLPFGDELADADRSSWPWVCLAGVGLGLLGLVICIRRDRRLAGRPHQVPTRRR